MVNFAHTHAFLVHAHTLSHTEAFTHRRFHRDFLHTDAFTHKHFYTKTLLHTEAFYTQTPLHTEAFTHTLFHTQTLLHTDAFTHKHFHTQRLLHTEAFTHRGFYTQELLHTGAFTHRRFYTQTILHTDAWEAIFCQLQDPGPAVKMSSWDHWPTAFLGQILARSLLGATFCDLRAFGPFLGHWKTALLGQTATARCNTGNRRAM